MHPVHSKGSLLSIRFKPPGKPPHVSLTDSCADKIITLSNPTLPPWDTASESPVHPAKVSNCLVPLSDSHITDYTIIIVEDRIKMILIFVENEL